jgi:tetratricopeptide (TPR) repeat protein
LLLTGLLLFGGAGCSQKAVYNRSIADLNQKAQQLLQQGDAAGAVSRLESALDLNPEEPLTLHNLAIAYEAKGDYDRSIQSFEKLLTLKSLGSGLDAKRIKQSLAVVYESKADKLMSEADEATENKTPETDAKTAALKEEALGGYRKALDTYDSLLRESGLSNETLQTLKAQHEALNKRITELQTGQTAGPQ